MAEVQTKEVMTEYPSRLQMSMLAPVRKIAALIPEGDKEVYIIGYIFGEARGVSFRNNPNSTDGSPAEALTGVFEGIPSYADMEGFSDAEKCSNRARLASGVCFLPPAANAAVVKAIMGEDYQDQRNANFNLKRGKRADVLGVVMPISIEVGLRKTPGEGGVGYEWVVRGLALASVEDPIARMRKQLGTGAGANLARLVDQSEKAALPAPEKSATKGAKKASRKR